MPLGGLAPNNQVYASQGESTPAAPLPEKYISTPPPAAPLSDRQHFVIEVANPYNAPIVKRAPRRKGMRYMYSLGHIRMPIQRLGADGQPFPWDSSFQPKLHGPIHNAGFNDQLFQAGYPGFNLGLSFRVPTVAAPAMPQPPQSNPNRGFQKLTNISQKLIRVTRAQTGPTGS